MSNVFFISDPHFGHKNLVNWRMKGRFDHIDDHDEWLIARINSTVTKRDSLWILGDIAWNIESMQKLARLNGMKKLVLGNHDTLDMGVYMKYSHRVYPGLVRYKGFWLSHPPIHPLELRGSKNIHGHVHPHSIPDDSYINVCVEALDGVPISLDELKGD